MPTQNNLTGTSWHTDDIDVERYLELLDVEHGPANVELLETLHGRHVRTFPFCAIDVLLGQHPGVEPATVSKRILVDGLGGYCFEHAQLFAAACEALGFEVTRRLGRVHSMTNTRTHTCIEVTIDGKRFLTDPGFGLSITGPIELTEGASRQEFHGEYTVHGFQRDGVQFWELRRNGETAHTHDSLPVVPVDVASGHLVTSTGSPFTKLLIASRFIGQEHHSLAGTTLSIRRADQPTERQELTVDETIETVQKLGVNLDEDRIRRLRTQLESTAPSG